MSEANEVITDLLRMAKASQQAGSPVKTAQEPETYHEVAARLTHTGWQLDAYVDNEEGADNERQKVIDAIELALDENGGELPASDRKQFAMRLRPLYREAAGEYVASNDMLRSEVKAAMANATAFTIDATIALWREKHAGA